MKGEGVKGEGVTAQAIAEVDRGSPLLGLSVYAQVELEYRSTILSNGQIV